MSANIGLNVMEVEGQATPSIQPAPTSVAAFIIRAPRGVPGRVEPITNWTEFLDTFGGYMEGAYGAYAVRGFFDNGGARAYVTRVAPSSAVPSAAELPNMDDKVALQVLAGERGMVNQGLWGDQLAVQVIQDTKEDEVEPVYTLVVKFGDDVVERWENLNNSEAIHSAGQQPEAVINDPLLGSNYIVVKKGAKTNPKATVDEGGNATFVPLADGAEGAFADEAQIAATAKQALPLFDVYELQLLCSPETTDEGWIAAAKTYCDGRGDCMFVGHTPRDATLAAASAYGQEHRADKVYGALYFPWILVSDPTGKPTLIPPSGHVMGIYARTERERGIWKAPAGNAASVNGALDVTHHITDVQHTDLVKNASVNAIRFIPGQGIIVDSSRTLSTNPLWLYVNVRLLFNFVKSSLKAGLRWVVQEPNDETLWNKVKYNSVTPFLMGLWRRGAFGPGAPEEVFTVKCDAENNSPADIQQGILNVDVYFYPSRPAETIIIKVGQQEGGATASEG